MYTSQGLGVQAVYGFCRMIKKLMNTFDPHYMALVWDSPGKTVRHEMYQEYKETRQAPPSDLFEQKDLIQEFADLILLRQVAQVGVEADDLMFSLAANFKAEGVQSLLVTSDKDMGQIISDDIKIYDPFKDIIIDGKILEEKYGFPIYKLSFYFALVGDSSDNIPGVRGIGPKGATDLVQQFDSLEDLYNNIEKISKERTRHLLIEHKDDAFLSEKLFKLYYYDVDVMPSECRFDKNNWMHARSLFERLQFKSLLKEMEEERSAHEQIIPLKLSEVGGYEFICITTEEALLELCKKLKTHKTFALDTETDGLNTFEAKLVGISLCIEPKTAYYIPFGHHTTEKQLSHDFVIEHLKPFLEDVNYKKYLHNVKFDQEVLFQAGIMLRGLVFDTLIAASLVVQDWQRLGLKYLSEFYLREPMLSFDMVVKKNGYHKFPDVPLDLATEYAAADAHQTFRLVKILKAQLEEREQTKLFEEIEFPLIQILFEMEKEGIILDPKILAALDKKIPFELKQLRATIINLIGSEFADINLNSSKQVADLLFNQLKLQPLKKTEQKTAYSTAHDVLKELSKIHPVPGFIDQYRELFKLKSTYIDSLPDYINPETGRIHTTFKQTAAITGRLASFDPNLQNIPTTSPTDIYVRSAFIPPEGHLFLSADYSQIELRVLAYLSQDAILNDAFKEGKDIHAVTASILFDVPITTVTHEQRQIAKRINFSILYGLTAYGLSKDLDIPLGVAREYREKYLAQYPGVTAWMDSVVEETKRHGYVTTLWGRRRYIPGIYERNKSLYEAARRIAINTAAQGTAAELTKKGMIDVYGQIREKNLGSKLILQIHDELLLTVPEEELEEIQKLVATTLQNVVSWNIPLAVTIRTGKNWHEVTKIRDK